MACEVPVLSWRPPTLDPVKGVALVGLILPPFPGSESNFVKKKKPFSLGSQRTQSGKLYQSSVCLPGQGVFMDGSFFAQSSAIKPAMIQKQGSAPPLFPLPFVNCLLSFFSFF